MPRFISDYYLLVMSNKEVCNNNIKSFDFQKLGK